jgi:CheY-like chemotaxis protein/signal transduction histidine kinase/HAMP domain-containing protein
VSGAVRLGLRTKLLAILAVATLSFGVLIITSKFTEDRVERQLALIARRHVPKLELWPKLEQRLDALRRNFQDAVGAQDAEQLEATHAAKEQLLAQLRAAGSLLTAADAARAQAATEAYFGAAYDVSRRLLAQETGEALVDAMGAMQLKYTRALAELKRAASLDQRELAAAFAQAAEAQAEARRQRLVLGLGCLLTVVLLSLWLSRGILRSVAEFSAGLGRFGRGDFSAPVRVTSRDEFGELASQANQMAQNLERFRLEREQADWLKVGHAGLLQALQGDLEPGEVAEHAARFLARYLEAPAAAIYAVETDGATLLLGQYGGATPPSARFGPGEGLVGQVARERELSVLSSLPPDYLRIRSGLGETQACSLALLPLVHVGAVTGVLEIALLKAWPEPNGKLLQTVRETLAITLEVARARSRLRELLLQTQRQAERLAAQEEELRAANEELQVQQEELREANLELTEQTAVLEEQRSELERKNGELSEARANLENKARELTTVSAYKSQFLANMSHELRTPLNSMLLLSGVLADNENGNLSDKQVEFSRTIHQAGKDLLGLINQVLDLSKVEAGKQDVRLAPVTLQQLAEHARRLFEPQARDKRLELRVLLEQGELPQTIVTDPRRVEQILNNLLGNAIKFTERGSVTLRIAPAAPDAVFKRGELRKEQCVTFAVIDTGIGIDSGHLERIFSPFEQLESSQDRRYGGTGLGLSIARELSQLLGGELQVQSSPGHGSTFALHLPFEAPGALLAQDVPRAPHPLRSELAVLPAAPRAPLPPSAASTSERVPRAELLIIEDDAAFAAALGELVESLGLAHVIAADGETGLALARTRRPSGIVLDVKLSDIDGFTMMEMLRSDARTGTIPVHFVSALEAPERGLELGAVGYLTKPASRAELTGAIRALAPHLSPRACSILIVEDDAALSDSLLQLLSGQGFEARRAGSAAQAFELLAAERFHCLVLDLGLPDMDGLELLQQLPERCPESPAVIVYTGRALSKSELSQLEAYAESVVMKEGPAAERLLDELRLFARGLQQGRAQRARGAVSPGAARHLAGRKILVADDDMRAVYALSALLRAKGLEPLVAESGRAALERLAEHPDIDVVLMDIMMPEMDGYEAMRRIRQNPRFAELPIIALTAKAMKHDQEKCLQAGATGYVAKPIDPELLFALLQSTLAHGLAHAG